MAADLQTLTTSERKKLRVLEAVVDRGMQSFVEVGVALLEIREQKLYRAEHTTFTALPR